MLPGTDIILKELAFLSHTGVQVFALGSALRSAFALVINGPFIFVLISAMYVVNTNSAIILAYAYLGGPPLWFDACSST